MDGLHPSEVGRRAFMLVIGTGIVVAFIGGPSPNVFGVVWWQVAVFAAYEVAFALAVLLGLAALLPDRLRRIGVLNRWASGELTAWGVTAFAVGVVLVSALAVANSIDVLDNRFQDYLRE